VVKPVVTGKPDVTVYSSGPAYSSATPAAASPAPIGKYKDEKSGNDYDSEPGVTKDTSDKSGQIIYSSAQSVALSSFALFLAFLQL
jgi:hypothetical protein